MSSADQGRSVAERIGDILATIEEVQEFISGRSLDEFRNDNLTLKAVAFNFNRSERRCDIFRMTY